MCGKEFERKSNATKYCSEKCAREAENKKLREKYKPKDKTRICLQCGQHFNQKAGSQKYCSKECAEAASKTRKQVTGWGKYKPEDYNKINVYPQGWLKYMVENGLMTQCPMCGEWTSSDSGFCPKHENNH